MRIFTIKAYSKKPVAEELDAVQKEAGIQFPSYLLEFLMQYGGAQVAECYWNEHNLLGAFLLPYNKNDASMDEIFDYVRSEEYIGRNDLIPFAVDISGRPFYVSVGVADNGVVYADRIGLRPVEEALVKVADSFEMFISGLRVDPEL